MVQDALITLREVHDKECEMYRTNSSLHPLIGFEYERFCEKKTGNILALGGDPSQYDVTDEWRIFWTKRLEELLEQSWAVKMKQCLEVLSSGKKSRRSSSSSSSSSYSSDSSRSDTQARKKRKRRKRKRKREERTQKYLGSHVAKKQKWESPVVDYPVTMLPDMTKLSQEVEYKESHMPSLLGSANRDGQRRTPLDNLTQPPVRQPGPPSLVEAMRGGLGQNIAKMQDVEGKWYLPSAPGVSDHHKKDMSKWYCLSMQGPSESMEEVQSRGEEEEDSGQAPGSWRQTLSGAQHTTEHSRNFIPMDELLHDEMDVMEEVGEELDEETIPLPSRPVRDLWMAISGRQALGDDPQCEGRSDQHQARDGQAQQSGPTRPGQRGDAFSHGAGKEMQGATYSTSNSGNKQGIAEMFRSFAAAEHSTTTITATTASAARGESSATALGKAAKVDVDVVNVLEVLTHLGDKLGTLFPSLKLLHQRAVELQDSGVDPIVVVSDMDNKFLLEMIREKLRRILQDGHLSVIKKAIVEEAEQRLSFLLARQTQQTILGDISLSHLARRCLDMDAPATVAYIREVLRYHGQPNPSQDQLMKAYMAVKAEQLKIVRDQQDDFATSANDPKPPQHTNLGGGSAGLSRATAFTEETKSSPHARFSGDTQAPVSDPLKRPGYLHFLRSRDNVGPPPPPALTMDPKRPAYANYVMSGGSVQSPEAPGQPSHTLFASVEGSVLPSPTPTVPKGPNQASHALLAGAVSSAGQSLPPVVIDALKVLSDMNVLAPGGTVLPSPAPGISDPPKLHPRSQLRGAAGGMGLSLAGASKQPPQVQISRGATSQPPRPLHGLLPTPKAHWYDAVMPRGPEHENSDRWGRWNTDQTKTGLPSTSHFTSTHSAATTRGGEVTYRQRSPKRVAKKPKPICITLPKNQPQKNFVGVINPLGDDTEEEYE